jgi:N-acetyl-gamma-glutamyl-phosphate reductase
MDHTCPGYSPWPIYGLPELCDRREIASAQAVANPGCYVTATLLALVPLVRAGLVFGTPVVDAKSGVSGAGRSRSETEYLLGELHGGFKPYKTTRHRHTPEIEQLLGSPVHFVPHLLPVSRGICATVHVPSTAGVEGIYDCWNSAYAGEPFVRTVASAPSTKQVHGSNCCHLFADFDDRTGVAVLVSVIDNLVKGAAGQAVQNMNLMLGLPEIAGLPREGVWP